MVPPTRRRLLLATGGLLVGAGCLGRGSTPTVSGLDEGAVQFEVVDPATVSTEPRDDGGRSNTPVVAFETDRVLVTGVVGVGSSKCMEATLERVWYDDADGTLRTTVVAGKSADHPDRKLLGGACPDDYSFDGYRLVVSSDATVNRVTAVERNAEDEEVSVTVSNS